MENTQTVAQGKIRLTQRGRVFFGALAGVLAAALMLTGAQFFGPSAVASDTSSEAADFGYVVPVAGDSLWRIAEVLDPQSDPRDLVNEIVKLNGMDSSALVAYEPLAVPLRYSDIPGVMTADEVGLEANDSAPSAELE